MENNQKLFVEDKLQIDTVTSDFFKIFNNTNAKKPGWDTLYETCIPEAIIIKKTGPSETIYSLASFIEPRQLILTNGTLINFSEWELNEETKITGQIAQRFSRYQKAGCLNGKDFTADGTKLFQFVKTSNGWKITAMVWEDD